MTDIRWSRSKPLMLGTTALTGGSVNQKIAQTISLDGQVYDLGNVYCYLYGPFGQTDGCVIYLDITSCNDDGSPLVTLATASCTLSDFSSNWATFTFDTTITVPTNGYLAFVMRMTGMDDNNYVEWAYRDGDVAKASAWAYSDGWVKNDGVVRALRINGLTDLFDLTNFKITTLPAEPKTTTVPLDSSDAEYTRTQYGDGQVSIDNPQAMVSFVVDSSGSMGWNDRLNNRVDYLNKVSNAFVNYKSDCVFDFISFGGALLDQNSLSMQTSAAPITINLDLSSPTRTTYAFTVSGHPDVVAGDIYSCDTVQFTILNSITQASVIYAIGTDAPPITSGDLVLVSGAGTNPVQFTAFTASSVSDGVTGYGITNLEDGHTYILGAVQMDSAPWDPVSLDNWTVWGTGATVVSSMDGPSQTASINVGSGATGTARKSIVAPLLPSYSLQGTIAQGATTLLLNTTDPLDTTVHYDIINRHLASMNHTLVSQSGNTLVVSPGSTFAMGSDSRLQQSSFQNAHVMDGTTLQLLVKDAAVSRPITFFLQTTQGYPMEWDITAFDDWKYDQIFWLGETAELDFTLTDVDGNPLPDKTRIDLLVDADIETSDDSKKVTNKYFVVDGTAGDTTIYVDDITGLVINDSIDLIDNTDQVQTVKIATLGSISDTKFYITLPPLVVLQYDFLVEHQAQVVYKNVNTQALAGTAQSKVGINLSTVDVTPIIAGRNLDPALLQPYDIAPVPYTTDYSTLNTNPDYIRNGATNLPTIDGHAVLRILPVTEDNDKTTVLKEESAADILMSEDASSVQSQLYQNQDEIPVPPAVTPVVPPQKHYVLETPIFLQNGQATSHMTSYETKLEATSVSGVNIPGVPDPVWLDAVSYVLTPEISVLSKTGVTVSQTYLPSQSLIFCNPINISDKGTSSTVDYWHWIPYDPETLALPHYANFTCRGTYADDGTYVIEYVVTDKLILIKNGQLHIRLYANTQHDLEAASMIFDDLGGKRIPTPQNQTFLNSRTLDGDQTINDWRNTVSQNALQQPPVSLLQSNDGVGYYADATQWSYATQYPAYEFDIPIVNGKATLTLPVSSVSCLLMVEASIPIPENTTLESIRADLIFVANPIDIDPFEPQTMLNINGADKYELSTNIVWTDNTQTIEDGTLVNVSKGSAPLSPTVGETDNGAVNGYFLGPLLPSLPMSSKDGYAVESIGVVVHHSSGWVRKVTRNVVYTAGGKSSTYEFFMYATAPVTTYWADGTPISDVVSIDLDDTTNNTVVAYNGTTDIPLYWVGAYGRQRLMGYQQPDSFPCPLYTKCWSVTNNTKVAENVLVPTVAAWDKSYVNLNIIPLNKNVGFGAEKKVYCDVLSSYMTGVSSVSGYATITTPDAAPHDTDDWSQAGAYAYKLIPISFKDPLSIQLYMDSVLVRDGQTAVNVVAEVLWKDMPLRKTVTVAGADITYPLPNVSFVVGGCSSLNNSGGDLASVPIDPRGAASACLTMTHNADVSLSSYVSTVGFTRTNRYTDLSDNTHTHTCELDSDGTGVTTSLIVLNGTVVAHTHVITNYSVSTAGGHTHEVASVALVQIQPTLSVADIYVNGTVVYDPSNCMSATTTSSPGTNRLAFNSVFSPGGTPGVTKPTLMMSIAFSDGESYTFVKDDNSSGPTFYTSKTITETKNSINCDVYTKWSSYIAGYIGEDPIIVPERPVDDGTRIAIEMDVFDAKKKNSKSVPAPYLLVSVSAAACVEGESANTTSSFGLFSLLKWIPSCTALVDQPSNDLLNRTTAIGKIRSLGASQMFDGLYLAADRAIQYRRDNNLPDLKHVIVLCSDGSENNSTVTIQQAVNNIQLIDHDNTIALFNQLSAGCESDRAILEYMSINLGGFHDCIFNMSSTQLDDLITEQTTRDSFYINNGYYANRYVFDEPRVLSSISMTDVLLPAGAQYVYRYRTSTDGSNYGAWSPYQSNIFIPEQVKIKALEYQAYFKGNNVFDSPVLKQGMNASYFEPRSAMIYFRPLLTNGSMDTYAQAVHITHTGEIPLTTEISYGYNQNGSILPDDYYVIPKGTVEANKYSIVLTRNNELLTSSDFRTYTALYGPWDTTATFSVYRFNTNNPQGVLVAPSLYVSNARLGTILFATPQPSTDYFCISVDLLPQMALMCKITNNGAEAATIDHIGLMYATMQRIVRDTKGNIIHQPLSARI